MTRRRSTSIRAVPRYSPAPSLPQILAAELDWHRDAVCSQTDPEVFYPERGPDAGAEKARAICADCPAKAKCLDWALDNHEHFGIWGGMTYRQRLREQGRRDRVERRAA